MISFYRTNVLLFALLGGLLLLLACGAEKKEEIEIKLKTRIEHQPVNEHYGDKPALIPLIIQSNYTMSNEMALLYYRDSLFTVSTDWKSTNFAHAAGDTFIAELPIPKKRGIVNYYCQITLLTGSEITLPKNAPVKTYSIVMKGEVPWIFKILHISFSHLALLLIIFAAFYAYKIISQNFPIQQCVRFTLLGLVSYVLGAFIFGTIIKLYAYGVFWQGYTVGNDGTDIFAFFVLLYWLFTLYSVKNILLKRREISTLFSEKVFAYLVLFNAIFYVLLEIIAH